MPKKGGLDSCRFKGGRAWQERGGCVFEGVRYLNAHYEVLRLCKAFVNGLSANIKLSRVRLSKMVQFGGILGRLLASLIKAGLPLMKNLLTPLAKHDFLSLDVTGATSATDAAVQKKIHGFF